jgi:hypothetical protein
MSVDTPTIYLSSRPDIVEKLCKLQEYGVNKSAVIKCALDACIDDIEKQKDKRKVRLNGKDVMLT